MNNLKFVVILTFMIMVIPESQLFAQIKFGVFADCQYADKDASGTRYYKNSLTKIDECIITFNKHKKLKFVAGLGDLIDDDFKSFDSVQPILDKSKYNIYQVVGNHDLAVAEDKLDLVPENLGMQKAYYSFSMGDWHFIFLNGSELFYHSPDTKIKAESKKLIDQLTLENKPNNKEWNGGIGKEQLTWLDNELSEAQNTSRKVVIFCHYPLLPLEAHTLWNSEEVLEILQKYQCVKMYMNGHNHAGEYDFRYGIHFITMQGMVETENSNSFAVVTLYKNQIKIDGYGREPDRILTF